MKIGFLTTLGVNVGDEFIRNGIRAVLDEIGRPYTPLYVNKHDSHSLSSPAEDEDCRVADKYADCDVFIQSGAPVYWNLQDGAKSTTSAWHQWAWVGRILKNKKPVFLNLGAGSCQTWGQGADVFLSSPECVQFAKDAHARSAITVVRDPVAHDILSKLSLDHHSLPCPAFLCAVRHGKVQTRPGLIGVNFMPRGAHNDIEGNFPHGDWPRQVTEILTGLRKMGRVVFIAHDREEFDFQSAFLQPGERIFFSKGWRDYLDLYGACSLVVANRVHGAVTAAGFGVPSVILGNDTRAQIGDFIDIPRCRAAFTRPRDILDCAASINSSSERIRLLELSVNVSAAYYKLLQPTIANV